jgi:hypothetical protein
MPPYTGRTKPDTHRKTAAYLRVPFTATLSLAEKATLSLSLTQLLSLGCLFGKGKKMASRSKNGRKRKKSSLGHLYFHFFLGLKKPEDQQDARTRGNALPVCERTL